MIAACGLGTHTLRLTCQDAHGPPAGALIAWSEGRSAERTATVPTIEAPSMLEEKREQTLKEYVWLDALHRLIHTLIDGDPKGPLAELLSHEERRVQINVRDGINLLGHEEWQTLWPEVDSEGNPEELQAADEQARLLAARLFLKLADSASEFPRLAADILDRVRRDAFVRATDV